MTDTSIQTRWLGEEVPMSVPPDAKSAYIALFTIWNEEMFNERYVGLFPSKEKAEEYLLNKYFSRRDVEYDDIESALTIMYEDYFTYTHKDGVVDMFVLAQ